MNGRKTYLLVMVLVEWLALIIQFVLFLQALPAGLAESLFRFFSFFTILTNMLVAVSATVLLVTPDTKRTGFFQKPGVQTAIVIYIFLVGIVYNILLRNLWHVSQVQAVIHDVLHTVTPLMTVIYWQKWVDTRNVQFKDIAAWLLYPLIYAICILIRGAYAVWYPYPFIDAAKLGYGRIAVNALVLAVLIVLFAAALVYWGRKKPVSSY